MPDAPPQQGYQLRFTPAELYRVGIEETRAHVRAGTWRAGVLGSREAGDRLKCSRALESGAIELPSHALAGFFETLLANTVEGFFADPAYGGNRDMVGWRMVGFPGAYAQYVDLVEPTTCAITREPISMANHVARTAHISGHKHP